MEAFGRSHELVRGHGWTVFGAIVVAFLILILAAFFAALIGAAMRGPGRDDRSSPSSPTILVAPFPALVSSVLSSSSAARTSRARAGP